MVILSQLPALSGGRKTVYLKAVASSGGVGQNSRGVQGSGTFPGQASPSREGREGKGNACSGAGGPKMALGPSQDALPARFFGAGVPNILNQTGEVSFFLCACVRLLAVCVCVRVCVCASCAHLALQFSGSEVERLQRARRERERREKKRKLSQEMHRRSHKKSV